MSTISRYLAREIVSSVLFVLVGFVALLVYVVYSNLISLTQAWVAQERVGFATGVVSVHAVFLAIVAALFWRRVTLSSSRLFRLPRRGPRA